MTTEVLYLRDLVSVDADFKPSVQLPFDYDNPAINERLVRSFIPTTQSIELLTDLAHSLNPNSTERARAIVGTFGTGKSDLLLMICNYFGRDADDPVLAPFYERLQQIDHVRATIIRRHRERQPRFLVVLLQADTVSPFPGFVLNGLERALEREGLGHLMTKTRYAAAREQIEAWQREGHPRYPDFCQILEHHEKTDVTGLLKMLSGQQADEALGRFLRSFKTVTGVDFHVYGYSQPHEAYAEVAKALVDSGAFSGILLVCDEFTSFLQRIQDSLDQQFYTAEAETKAVENLAERSGSSGRAQIHFIVASLESFASAANDIRSGTVAKATERSGGRFKHHSLMVQGSEELIRGAIKRLPRSEHITLLPNAQRDDLLAIANSIGQIQTQWQNREWIRHVVIDGAFPLHPYTTYALPLINQKVAQSQRTMFLFLKDEKGLRGYIQNEPLLDIYPGWHRLLTLDALFDYFRESIATKRSEIFDAFEHATQQISTATIDREIAQRILKIVALCEVIGNDLVLRPTWLFLRRALNLPSHAVAELDTALQLLEQHDAIESPSEYGDNAGIYRLPARGWVSVKSLRQRITSRAQNLSATDIAKLQSTHKPEPIPASDYNRTRGSHRQLNAYYIGINTLRSRERLKSDLDNPDNRDGLLWYIIASNDSERLEAQSLARELTSQHDRLVIAVPVRPSHILSALRDYQALEMLRRDPELEQASKPYLEDTGKVGREYKARLDHELKSLADSRQWEWFAAGRGQIGLTAAACVTLASLVMEKVFPDTPLTDLGQHFKPGSISANIAKAVESLVKGDVQLLTGSKSPVDSILRKGAVAIGLLALKQTNGSYEMYTVADPTSSANLANGKIWRRMNDHLAAGKPWANLVRELRQPPFGLYDCILILFLAAFIARNADSIAIYKTGAGNRASDVDPNLLKAMLERASDYSIRYQPLTDIEKRWLRGIVERGLRQSDFNLSPGTTLRAAVATRIKAWFNRQQIPMFALSFDQSQLSELLPDADPTTLRVVQLLLQSQSNNLDLTTLILSELPHSLGAPEQHKNWNQTTVDMLLANWMTVCEYIGRLPIALKERYTRRAAALFNADHVAPEHRWSEIHRWRYNRGAVQPDRLQGLARELFRMTNLSDGSIEQTLLDDFARRVITVGMEYQRWQDLEKLEKVFAELAKARDEINRAWEEVAPGDDIWREGLVRLITGRSVSGASAERAATELGSWCQEIAWPACAKTLSSGQLQAIYTDVDHETCRDLTLMLKRIQHDKAQWLIDLQEGLPKEFGIHGYTKNEVNAALRRIETVLPLAAGLESKLRRHILIAVSQLFTVSFEAPNNMAIDQILPQWRDRYTISEPNDLSTEAKSLLFHVNHGAADPETLLFTTLPRSIPAVGRPVHQWERLDVLETYCETLKRSIVEIANYQPVTPVLSAWMVGILHAIHQPVSTNSPRERQRLVERIATELHAWVHEQRMPVFAGKLTAQELCDVYPMAEPPTIAALLRLIQCDSEIAARHLISEELPKALGLGADDGTWTEPDVTIAIAQLADACQLVMELPHSFRRRLFVEIGRVFDPQSAITDSADLLKQIREWCMQYVILPNDPISPNARLLYDTLGRAEDDASGLLLQRLPARIAEVRATYDNWTQWSLHQCYLDALRVATTEISEHGQVGDGSMKANGLWQDICQRLKSLDADERRWIVKAFRDEFQQ